MIETSSMTALQHYERALECGERGQQCENAKSVAAQLSQLIEKTRLLTWLEQQKGQIRLRLDGELHITPCQEAIRIYNAAPEKANNLQPRLTAWWNEVVARACERLRQRASAVPAGSNLFAKIEPWVCIVILTGSLDTVTRAQIEQLQDVVDDLEKRVEKESNDFEGSNHAEYLTFEPKKDVLRRQVELCEQLRTDLRDPQLALQVCRAYLENGAALEQRLKTSVASLNAWLDRLKGFERDLSTTIALANAALRTGDFQPVHDAIGRAVGTTPLSPMGKTAQPGMAFTGFTLHPTFGWLKDFIEQQKKRHANQVAHKQYVEWGLPLETVLTVAELDAIGIRWKQENQNAPPELRQKHADLINDLWRALEMGKYPLERTFEHLEKMHADEPGDVCRLQAQLVYTDPETGKSYEGYERINPVLKAKVDQVQNMREWLAQFSVVAPHITIRRACPGIVNWDVEKPLIEKQRDRCDLKAALMHCQQVRGNPEDSLFNGLWPLERAKAELQRVPDELRKPLSAAARTLDKERVARFEKLSKQIDECIKIEQDINWRKDEQPKRWEEVLEQLANLRNTHESLWVRLFRQTRSIEEALESFRAACKSYAEVCPCDPLFLKILDEENGAYTPPARCKD